MTARPGAGASRAWQEFGEALRELRGRRNLALRDLGRQVCWSYSLIAKWERGERRPPTDAVKALDTALNVQGELVATALCAAMADIDRSRRGTNGLIPSTKDQDDEMERRALVPLIGALAAGTAIPAGTIESVLAGIERALGTSVSVDDWEETVREYGYLISTRPVGSLIGELAADVIAVGHLLNRDHPPAVHTGLQRVSAGLSGLLAVEFGDAGERRAARLAWATARRAADASGDRDLSVWVRAKEADEGLYLGRPTETIVKLIDDAIRIANGSPSPGLVRAYSVRSRLAADRGDRRTALAALRDNTTTLERLPDRFRSDHSVWGYTDRRASWAEAYTYTVIGDDRADAALTRAFGLYPSNVLGPVVNLHLIRATHLVRKRDVEEGLQYAISTLGKTPLSAFRRHMTGHLLNSLPKAAQSLAAARELQALTAVTLASSAV